MVNPTSPMVHLAGVLLFIITGRVSWEAVIRSHKHNRPVFHVYRPSFSHTDFRFGHRPRLVPTRLGSNVLFCKRTTNRAFHKPGQVLLSCSSISHQTGFQYVPTGTHFSGLSLVFPTILPVEYICIASVTSSFHDLVTVC